MKPIIKIDRVLPLDGNQILEVEVNPEKIFALGKLTTIPGTSCRGYCIWFSPHQEDCWWAKAKSYNQLRGSFHGDSKIMYKPMSKEDLGEV